MKSRNNRAGTGSVRKTMENGWAGMFEISFFKVWKPASTFAWSLLHWRILERHSFIAASLASRYSSWSSCCSLSILFIVLLSSSASWSPRSIPDSPRPISYSLWAKPFISLTSWPFQTSSPTWPSIRRYSSSFLNLSFSSCDFCNLI